MAEARIKIAKADIIKVFEESTSNIYKRSNLDRILEDNRTFWRLRRAMTVDEFIKFLLQETKLKKVSFGFPNRKIIKYVWGEALLYELLTTLQPACYFSHYTAMYLHGLTEQVPKTIYINKEQTAKSRGVGALTQERIDFALRQPTRISNNFTEYQNYKIYLLNGKNTGNLGVIQMNDPEEERIRVTDIERTLIDVTVRPVYAGGVFEVLKAYKLAQPKVSVNKLTATLKKLDYIYPYHQAVGFYLERAGVYKESSLSLLKKLGFKYDFYLMHQVKEKEYSKKWRLYFPKGL